MADQANFPDIYIDGSSAGDGSLATPYSDFSDINWTTGGDNSIFGHYAGAETASVTINLKKGVEWRETLTPGASGSATYPIIVRSYGSGVAPIINSTDVTTGWEQDEAWATVYTATLDADANTDSDFNRRWVIANASISGDGTSVRLTMEAHSTDASIVDGTSIGQRDGTSDDYIAGAFSRVTFVDEGGGNAITIPAGTEVVSDAIDVSGWGGGIFDNTKDHLVHHWFDDHGVQYIRTNESVGGGRYSVGNDDTDATMTQTIAYGAVSANKTGTLTKIEALSATANVWKKTGITAQPYIVIFDGTIGTYQTSKANLSSARDWFWDTGTDILYTYSATDPDSAYSEVEVATRSKCIDVDDKDYLTFQDLKLYGARDCAIGNLNDCDYITIKDSEIVAMGRFGTIFAEATNILFQNLHIHDITVEEAFYINALSENGTNNITIEHCNIHDMAENGIYLGTSTADGTQDIIIRYNKIYDVVDTWNTGSLSAGGGGDGWGIQGKNTDGLEIYYNWISNTDKGGIDLQASNSNSNVNVYNNTVYGSVANGCAQIGGATVNIKNNIFMTDSNGEPLLYILTGATSVTISNNRYYTTGNGTDAFHWLGTDYDYADFGDWVTASSDSNSSVGDPKFIDAANDDFRLLMGSICRNAGTDVSLLIDYLGILIRHAPDIGAYEEQTNALF